MNALIDTQGAKQITLVDPDTAAALGDVTGDWFDVEHLTIAELDAAMLEMTPDPWIAPGMSLWLQGSVEDLAVGAKNNFTEERVGAWGAYDLPYVRRHRFGDHASVPVPSLNAKNVIDQDVVVARYNALYRLPYKWIRLRYDTTGSTATALTMQVTLVGK